LHSLEHQPLCTRSLQLLVLEMVMQRELVLVLGSALALAMQRELVSGLLLALMEELHV
jgi:hypothetical protein